MKARNFIDMTGWVMSEHGVPESRLTVIEQAETYINKSGQRKTRWLCECSCKDHNRIVADAGNIRNGNTLSCGCYNKEIVKQIFKKYNNYSDKMTDEYGDYYIGYTSNTNKEFYVDAEDFDKIKEYSWWESKNETISRLGTNINGKTVRMHVLIGYKNYDHADRNKLNNRRYNLRPCTVSQNAINKGVRSNNTSGVTGVSWSRIRNKWVVQITKDHKTTTIGSFINKEDAIKVRLEAELKYFGDFAPQRHLFEQYGITDTQQND